MNEQQSREIVARVLGEIRKETGLLAMDPSPETEANTLEYLTRFMATVIGEFQQGEVQLLSWVDPAGKLLLILAERARKRADGER